MSHRNARIHRATYRASHRQECCDANKMYRNAHKAQISRGKLEYRRRHPKLVAWQTQKAHAKYRGIVYLLTFEEFVSFWGDRFEYRGREPDSLCMGRYGDEGSYMIGNIYICPFSENKEGPRPLPVPTW